MTENGTSGKAKPAPAAERELTVAEVLAEYPDRWILMAVTRRNAADQPAAGIVVGCNRTDKAALSQLKDMKQLARTDLGLFLFFANEVSVPRSIIEASV
jgi:hypothetical protein